MVVSPLSLQIPLTPQRFQALNRETQNLLIAEQLLGWVCVIQPNAEAFVICPPTVAAKSEHNLSKLMEWQQSYGTTDFAGDLHAIEKVLQQIELHDLELVQKPCSTARLFPWTVTLIYKGRTLSGAANHLHEIPSLIAMLCLQFAGVVL